MATPDYVEFDDSLPTTTSKTLTAMCQDINSNELALRDELDLGESIGCSITPTYDTSPNEGRPASVLYKRGTRWRRTTYTYGTSGAATGFPTSVLSEYSTDSGSSWKTIKIKTMAYEYYETTKVRLLSVTWS